MEMVIIPIIFVLVSVVVFIIFTYNSLVKSRNNVKNAAAQIDTQLQRRFDLIPNLVETVKGYASHEKKLLESITASRTGFMNASSDRERFAVNDSLTSALKSLFAVAENYPDLKANTNFVSLQRELSETEDKVTYARQFYNDAVTIYNTKLEVFPSSVVASMFHFVQADLLEAQAAANEAPEVKF